MSNNYQRHRMFDDIKLTKQQRQQMRDLMREAKLDRSNFNVAERQAMHKLVTAEKFDETAVYAQAQKMAQDQVKHRVEMARVHNKMYNLLTEEQKKIVEQKHNKRMEQLANSEQVDWRNGQPGKRSPRM
jgi:protein CpxP